MNKNKKNKRVYINNKIIKYIKKRIYKNNKIRRESATLPLTAEAAGGFFTQECFLFIWKTATDCC